MTSISFQMFKEESVKVDLHEGYGYQILLVHISSGVLYYEWNGDFKDTIGGKEIQYKYSLIITIAIPERPYFYSN